VRKKVTEKVKGAAIFFQQEDTNTNDESSMESKPSVNSEIASTVTTESNVSVKVSTNTNGIPKKAKYLETRVQRSYYLDKDLVKELDKFAKKNDYDKSDIINWILKEYLSNNGK
jgi:hypothetical protein